jgi:hypothetical protein
MDGQGNFIRRLEGHAASLENKTRAKSLFYCAIAEFYRLVEQTLKSFHTPKAKVDGGKELVVADAIGATRELGGTIPTAAAAVPHTNPNTTQTRSQPCRKGHNRLPQMIPPGSCKEVCHS